MLASKLIISIFERYPTCLQWVKEDDIIPEFDELYLDLASIIYHFQNSSDIFNYIDDLISMIKPRRVIHIALDGVDAEETNQTTLSQGEELPEDASDSNSITPDTTYLKKLTAELRYFITQKVNQDANWRNVEVTLSGSDVPGKGKYKIMESIHSSKAQPTYDFNVRSCLYSLDADLVIMGLSSRDPHFVFMSEASTFHAGDSSRQGFAVLWCSLWREYLQLDLQAIRTTVNRQRLIDDMVLLLLLLKSPFLPSLFANEDCYSLLLRKYISFNSRGDKFLHHMGTVDINNLSKYLENVAHVFEVGFVLEHWEAVTGNLAITQAQIKIRDNLEAYILSPHAGNSFCLEFYQDLKAHDKKFINLVVIQKLGLQCSIRYEFINKGLTRVHLDFRNRPSSPDEEAKEQTLKVFKSYKDADIIPQDTRDPRFVTMLKQCKDYYYQQVGLDINEQMGSLVRSYLEGVQWTIAYFIQGRLSWNFQYEYDYAPKIFDIGLARFGLGGIVRSQEHEAASMARVGTTYKFSYDENLANLGVDELPVYRSPLPNVLPDIHNCMVREEVYSLADVTSEDLRLTNRPMHDATMGQHLLAGFPSLRSIPYRFELKRHDVNTFGQKSRNESIVISIENMYRNAKIQTIANQKINQLINVHYPYLQQALVIGVSDREMKYQVDFNKDSKPIMKHIWNNEEKKSWASRVGLAKDLLSKRLALVVGDVKLVLHVLFLIGVQQREDGTLIKQFADPCQEELVPIQLVENKVANPDPRFIQKRAPSIQDGFPLESTVFYLDNKFLGGQATVVGHSDDNVDIEMTVPVQDRHQSEAEFGHMIARKQEIDIQYEYEPLDAVALEFNISTACLSKITSKFEVRERDTLHMVGLNLKSDASGEKVLGFTRKNTDGNWEFSTAAVTLIGEYCTKFPEFVQLIMERQIDSDELLTVSDFGWTTEGSKALHEMKDWIKSKKLDALKRAILETEELKETYCHDIEKAAVKYHEKYENLDFKKVVIPAVPRKLLLKPADAKVRLCHQSFALGDRVIYVCDSGSVPLANKGTVIGVQEKVVDVVFDTKFISGTTLGGRCSEFRGATLRYSTLINTSNQSEQSLPSSNPQISLLSSQSHGRARGRGHGVL